MAVLGSVWLTLLPPPEGKVNAPGTLIPTPLYGIISINTTAVRHEGFIQLDLSTAHVKSEMLYP